MKKTFFLLFTLLLLALAAQTTLACRCGNGDEVALTVRGEVPFDGTSYIEDYEENNGAIFVGRVLKIKTVKTPEDDFSSDYLEITLSVSKSWAGARSKRIVVYTNKGAGSCGYPFKIGGSYVVFALSTEAFADKLGVSSCTYTTPLDQAKNILKGLGEAKVSL